MFSLTTPVADYFRLAYVPDKLPGTRHSASREQYFIEIRKLDRYFQRWLVELEQPSRPLALGDLSNTLLKYAMSGEIEKGNEASTANKLLRHVLAIANHAHEAEILERPLRTKPYKELKREPRAWLPEEYARIVDAAFRMPGNVGPVSAADFWLALMLVDGGLGVRITALMLIPTANWDPVRAELLVPAEEQKQRADQVFALWPSANEALLRLAPHERGLKFLFGDWPYDPDRGWRVLRKHLRRLLVLAGLFDKTCQVTRRDLFHKVRKTVGTEIAIKKGIAAAREYLGHSSEQVTQLYIDKRRIERVRITDVLEDPGAKISALRLFGEAS